MDLEKLYLNVVVKANRGTLRDQRHSIIDYELARMSVEQGQCSSFWLNPLFIREEDRRFFPEEALTNRNRRSSEVKE